jgi:hypothetical protein
MAILHIRQQRDLVAHQNNKTTFEFELFECDGTPIDTSGLTKSLKIYDIFNNLVLDLPIFELSTLQSANLRTTRYRYTWTVDNFTYYFGDLLILAK